VPNPNPSSPIFSSVLKIHFGSDFSEKRTEGFTLSLADQQALANGQRVRLSNGDDDRITVELIANFPDYFSEPLPGVPNNVRGSNPFDLVAVGGQERHDWDDDHDWDRRRDDLLYVTDGGRNFVWKVEIKSGAFSIISPFPQIANPFFNPTPPPPPLGPPFIDAVPTGIRFVNDQLLVTLFRGFPFPSGIVSRRAG